MAVPMSAAARYLYLAIAAAWLSTRAGAGPQHGLRDYEAGGFLFSFGDAKAGWVSAFVEGDPAKAEVISPSTGSGSATSQPRVTAQFEVRGVLPPVVSDWMEVARSKPGGTPPVTIVGCDQKCARLVRRSYEAARPLELSLPALDRSSTTPVSLRVLLAATRVMTELVLPDSVAPPPPVPDDVISPSRFRVSVAGLPTFAIARMESATLRTDASTADLAFVLPLADARTWEISMKGNQSARDGRVALYTMSGATAGTVVFRLVRTGRIEPTGKGMARLHVTVAAPRLSIR